MKSPRWIALGLMLTTCFLACLSSITVPSELSPNGPSSNPRVTTGSSGGSGHPGTVRSVPQGTAGPGAQTHLSRTTPRVKTPTVTSTASPVNGSLTRTSASGAMTPGVTPGANPTTSPTTTPTTTPTTSPTTSPTTTTSTVTPTSTTSTTSPTTTLTTTLTTTPTTTRTTTPTTEHQLIIHEKPDRTGALVVLFLLLSLLAICLYCAWKKLQEFGGRGSYYPCQMDKRLYVNPEEAEGGARGLRPMGQAFMEAARGYLPWRAGPRPEGLEEDEEELEAVNPEGGESEGEGSEGTAGCGSSGESRRSDSDDYSSLGGLDLRERAGRAEGGEGEGGGCGEEGEGGEKGDLPDGEEVLSDLHSFSGTATWTDTKHDVTVL